MQGRRGFSNAEVVPTCIKVIVVVVVIGSGTDSFMFRLATILEANSMFLLQLWVYMIHMFTKRPSKLSRSVNLDVVIIADTAA